MTVSLPPPGDPPTYTLPSRNASSNGRIFRSPVSPSATAAASWTAASLEATSAMCLAIAGGGAAAPRAAAGAVSPDSSASARRSGVNTSPLSRLLKKVRMRGGARGPHARRTPGTSSVRPRAPTKERGPFRQPASVSASHQAFFWYVPWCLIQSQPLSGLVYWLHGSAFTSPLERDTTLNWP